MKIAKYYMTALVLTLLLALSGAAGAQEPQMVAVGGCVAGTSYDPDCDVDHNGATNIVDLQLVAHHWGQTGVFMSDNTHDHLGQTWTGSSNPLSINGSFTIAPLLLSNGSSTGDGLHVGPVGGDGVVVSSAGFDGVRVNTAAGGDGMFVGSAGFDGVHIDDGAAGDFAGYFGGNVQIGNGGTCTGCILSVLGRNVGQTTLEPGDVVTVRAVAPAEMAGTPAMMEVELATVAGAPIGVVAGRAEVSKHPASGGKAEGRLVPREGPAAPGDYVNIVVSGVAQVKASAVASSIEPGARLTVADAAGHVRPVRTIEVQGVPVSEGSPVLGVALEKLEAGQAGLIWTLVNPR